MAHQRPRRKYRKNSDRTLRVRGVRHDPPDPKRLSKALLALAAELAAAQAEADAQAAARDEVTHEGEHESGGQEGSA
ncbi:hypothetical protein ACXPWS_05010 [Mycobacterium sp. BMJ-28]